MSEHTKNLTPASATPGTPSTPSTTFAPGTPSAPGAPSTGSAPGPHQGHGHASPGKLGPLALGALGVVFGDIGTSPLYTFKECISSSEHPLLPTPENILGICSLIVWSLTLVVTVKYMSFIMKADNHGEGGILALLALIPEKLRSSGHAHIGWVALLVIIGAALLFGDGIITPAISVLSALEGLEVATTRLKPLVIPLTCLILFGLFAVQKRGTAGVGKVFGPIMVLWFGTIGVLGLIQIVRYPQVLWALSPVHAARFFLAHGIRGVPILGSVVLAVTGGEALYADMGHFGRRPIRVAWLALAMPTLILCYLGQGALLLADSHVQSPFYSLVPSGALTYAMVILSGAATVIASQALISGVFSLTHQAVQLGFFPRVTITHTSRETEGQIYVPEINWGLALMCIALVLGFRESSRLAAAYGIAVTGTMAITSIVYYVVARQTWGWSRVKALPVLVLFLSFDIPFLAANMLKFVDGGYLPILVGALFFIVMVIWKVGRVHLREYTTAHSPGWDDFTKTLLGKLLCRIPGGAVYLSSHRDGVPPLLANQVERMRVLHEVVLLLTVTTEHVPQVPPDEQLEVQALQQGFYRIVGRYGFMETPRIPALVAKAAERLGLHIDPTHLTYFLGRETFIASDEGKMGRWTEGLFSFLSRNSRSATDYFGIPPEQVMEIGAQIDL